MGTSLKTLFVTALLTIPIAAAPSDVIEVPGDARTIQEAVDRAGGGEVLLIAPGDYGESVVIVGKGLTLVADGGPVGLRRLVVRSVPESGSVVLRGLEIDAGPSSSSDAGLVLLGNAGSVRVEACSIEGANATSLVAGGPGARVTACRSVTFVRSLLRGGFGFTSEWEWGTAGGAGLEIEDASVAVFDSTLIGHRGGDVVGVVDYGMGGRGGHGVVNGEGGALHMAGSLLIGGDGGTGSCDSLGLFLGMGGDGGHGLYQTGAAARVSTRGCSFAGGA
ncbi:MAG: right-handed parallel beta-helix repeat-containing protein [Planctomycetota bacterium]|jgi:hypothetical protein